MRSKVKGGRGYDQGQRGDPATGQILGFNQGPKGIDKPVAELVIAPGRPLVFGYEAVGEQDIQFPGCQGRVDSVHQSNNAGHMRGGHGRSLKETIHKLNYTGWISPTGAEHAIRKPIRVDISSIISAGGG